MHVHSVVLGFPGGSDGKEPACNAGDIRMTRVQSLGRKDPLQYSCLGNLMDRRVWRAAVHGVIKSRTRLSDFHFIFIGTKILNFSYSSTKIPALKYLRS